MKGLLVKDFIMIKKHGTILLIVSALFFILSLAAVQSMYFSYYSVALISLLPVTILAYDEAYKWNKYEVILPVDKKLAVCEKYLLLIIFVIPAILIECLVFYFTLHFSLDNILSLMYLMLFCGLIAPIIVLPVTFRFGYLKGKLTNILIVGILAASISVINAKNISGGTLIEGNFTPVRDAFMFAVIAVVLFIISLLISANVYKKREF